MNRGRLYSFMRFLLIFLFIAFVLTSSFMLFFHGIDMKEEDIRSSAAVTFGNAVFIALIVQGLEALSRKLTVDKPVSRISKGLERITDGDFTYKIKPLYDPLGTNRYNDIIGNINRMTDELAGVETLRTDFVSNVSHEMKTPLALIRNYAALLEREGLSDQERQEYARAIDAASKRLAELITNILKLNKLENQQIFPDVKRYDLSEQVAECMLEFENEWESNGINIETDITDGVMINADPELLSVVWHNLLSNALKFTGEGGTVTLKVYEEDGFAKVGISDTGCGMDSETGRHIFEKFYQGDTSHASRGNGLGLALVKRIIDITNSEISVSSKLGEGSTFLVSIRKNTDEHKKSY